MANTNTQLTSEEFKKIWEATGETIRTPQGTLQSVNTTWNQDQVDTLKTLWESLGRGPEPKPKTDAEWEEVARNHAGDAEVTALLRLLDIERAAVKALAAMIKQLETDCAPTTKPESKPSDWTAFSTNPKAPLIPYE